MMKTEICKLSDQYRMLMPGDHILCAVSGGADSMAMMGALLELSATMGFTLSAAHYNHGLRGGESDRDEAFVKNYCEQNHISIYCGQGDVSEQAKRSGKGIEETARNMRYAFLKKTAQETGCNKIATAHTAGDNVETVLLNLARGSALKGLCGIPPVRENLIRPMLRVSRKQVEDYLIRRNIPHIEDSSNRDLQYRRNKVREGALPVLREINPDLDRTVGLTTDKIRQDDEFLYLLAREELGKCGFSLDQPSLPVQELEKQPYPLSSRMIRLVLSAIGCTGAASSHIDAVFAIAYGSNPSAKADLPQNTTVCREYDRLLFLCRRPSRPVFTETPVCLSGETALPVQNLTISCRFINKCTEIVNSVDTFTLKYDMIIGKLAVRPRKAGDRLYLRSSGKSLKKLMIDLKIPARQRDLIPVIAHGSDVAAVYGIGVNSRYAARPGDDVYQITICAAGKKAGGDNP